MSVNLSDFSNIFSACPPNLPLSNKLGYTQTHTHTHTILHEEKFTI